MLPPSVICRARFSGSAASRSAGSGPNGLTFGEPALSGACSAEASRPTPVDGVGVGVVVGGGQRQAPVAEVAVQRQAEVPGPAVDALLQRTAGRRRSGRPSPARLNGENGSPAGTRQADAGQALQRVAGGPGQRDVDGGVDPQKIGRANTALAVSVLGGRQQAVVGGGVGEVGDAGGGDEVAPGVSCWSAATPAGTPAMVTGSPTSALRAGSISPPRRRDDVAGQVERRAGAAARPGRAARRSARRRPGTSGRGWCACRAGPGTGRPRPGRWGRRPRWSSPPTPSAVMARKTALQHDVHHPLVGRVAVLQRHLLGQDVDPQDRLGGDVLRLR